MDGVHSAILNAALHGIGRSRGGVADLQHLSVNNANTATDEERYN